MQEYKLVLQVTFGVGPYEKLVRVCSTGWRVVRVTHERGDLSIQTCELREVLLGTR
eukprot:COSAG02_NODE_2329_length_9121_cov_3.015183_9_plen_56_part_00